MNDQFISKIIAPLDPDVALWFIFRGNELLLTNNAKPSIPIITSPSDLNLKILSPHYLGKFNGTYCFCSEVNENTQVPSDMFFQNLKLSFSQLGDTLFKIAGKALQILQWDRNYQFCSRCSMPLKPEPNERAKVCPECKLFFYPKLSPAIIVAVTRGDEILLARSPRFATGFYSVLAGFIEPGETAEEAVKREVQEEVGITVHNIRYFGTQHWPFPDSFMIGFLADYLAGEIVMEANEIEDAQWFNIKHLPALPSTASIARSLIEKVLVDKS